MKNFLSNKKFVIAVCLISFIVSGLIISWQVFGVSVTSNMDMGDGKIINLGTPTYDDEAATKEYVDSAVTELAQLWTDSGSYIYPQNTSDFVITDYGQVGIGTSPSYDLDVYGDMRVSGISKFDSIGVGNVSPSYYGDFVASGNGRFNGSTWLGDSSYGDMTFITGGLRVDGETRLGYGGQQTLIDGDLRVIRDVNVSGSLSVSGSKNFVINHPLDPENKQLVHSTLEGPEIAVFYRGEAQLQSGKAIIELPSYFEALTRKEGRTVLLTPKFDNSEPISSLAASSVADGKFQVRAVDGNNTSQKFYWEVKAIRADVPPLEVEKVKTEAEK